MLPAVMIYYVVFFPDIFNLKFIFIEHGCHVTIPPDGTDRFNLQFMSLRIKILILSDA